MEAPEQQQPCPFVLLKPTQGLPRLSNVDVFHTIRNPNNLEWWFREYSPIDADDVVAIDLETKGGDAHDVNSIIVGLALSDNRGTIYVDLRNSHPDTLYTVIHYLRTYNIPLIAHNVPFDAAYLYRDSSAAGKGKSSAPFWLNWKYCTYALYRHLATEGWAGQTWSLKDAQKELLLWPETNELALDNWLIANGHVTGKGKAARPDKSLMHLAPSDILGYYCALDADSTYLLYRKILLPTLRRFPHSKEYFGPITIGHCKQHIVQQLRGIAVEADALRTYSEQLTVTIQEKERAILEDASVRPFIEEYNASIVLQHRAKQPPTHRKDGQPSKNWESWKVKLEELLSTGHFNINSGKQKQWLLYEKLKFPVKVETDSEQAATNVKALSGMGTVGRLFIEQNEAVKEQSYVQACLDSIRKQQDGTSILHYRFKVPGTLTGRLSGTGGFNFQQQPKSRDYLRCFKARPGYRFVSMDFTALEQVVLAELSKDPALYTLYGPGAKPNDVYLFTGSSLPGLGKAILAAGYDPKNPTPEGIANAKKKAKKERAVSKIVTLGSSYGMGARKLRADLSLAGIEISEQESFDIQKGYWTLYAGVKTYEKELLRQYQHNGGWILNGIGRPISIAEGYEKDIVNRVVQSTGHDILMLWVDIFTKLLDAAGIPWYPIIIDLHDESIIEVPERFAEQAQVIMSSEAMKLLNEYLQGVIPLKGEGKIANTLADIKVEE